MFSFIKRNKNTANKQNSSNDLPQAEQFNKTAGLSGIVVTKLDGTAKGGIIFAIAKKLNIPIRFIGVGESIDDLRPFDGKEFVTALLSRDNSQHCYDCI